MLLFTSGPPAWVDVAPETLRVERAGIKGQPLCPSAKGCKPSVMRETGACKRARGEGDMYIGIGTLLLIIILIILLT